MKATIISQNGQVLIHVVNSIGLPNDNSYTLTSVNGVDFIHLVNGSIIVNTYEMEDKESLSMIRNIAKSLVSSEGKVIVINETNNKKSLKKVNKIK